MGPRGRSPAPLVRCRSVSGRWTRSKKEDAVVNIRAPNNAGSEREQATTTAARPVMKDILVN